ncbi:MAG: SdpI family protein [Acutalibacteraceae bacterium]|nr:SdpI family protein [Acutalibacteraceae bacterium]
MIKKNLKTVIATALITLSPIVIGLLLWDKLPDEIATHFGTNGLPDRYSSKAFAVFGLPFVMLAIHLFGILATKADPKHSNITDKNFKIVLWIAPLLSVVLCVLSFAYSINNTVPVVTVLIIFMGVLFVITGNLMPKVKQNYSIGIKLPHTLNDKDNWYKTHRFAGKIWVIGGVVICLTAVLENIFVFLAITLVMAFAPMVYSYIIARKISK